MRITGFLRTKPDFKLLRLPALKDILPCALLFLASRASVLGLFPFGAAMFAAAFDKSLAYIGVTVLCLGAFTAGAQDMLLKYALSGILFWLYTRLREDHREWTLLSSVVCGCCMFIGGCTLMIYRFGGTYDFMILGIESILSAFMYIVFDKGRDALRYNKNKPSEQDLISGAICIGVFITGLSGVYLPFGVNLSRCITAYCIMCIALHENLAVSGSGGIAAGLICSMNDLAAITLTGLYGICAMFSNLLKHFGKYGVGLGFLGGAAVTLLYVGNSFTIPLSITETALSVCLFVLTPKKIHNAIGSFFMKTLHSDIVPADIRMRQYVHTSLVKAANAFSSLNAIFLSVSNKRLKLQKKDMCDIFDTTAERVCTSCENHDICWRENFHDTYRLVFSFLEIMETEGNCTIYNIPAQFKAQCIYCHNFVNEFNHMYEIYKYRTIHEGQAVQNRDMVCEQYNEFSKILLSLAQSLDNGFRFLEPEEEKIADELQKAELETRSVHVIEGTSGDLEVYLLMAQHADLDLLEEKLTKVLNTPIGYECTLSGGLLKFISKGIYELEIGCKQIPKDGYSVCGDNFISFKAKDNKHYIMICDGMGSGRPAQKESYLAGTLLEEFLRAGFGAKTAVNLINSTLSLKIDTETFSCIDLLSIDLLTGQADFYKIGANKSYIMRGERVETVFSESLPAGMLSAISINPVSKRLEDGDIIIMMSDGVSDSGFGILTGERLKKILNTAENSPEEMAALILKGAVRKRLNGAEDDMTTAVIKINAV